MASSPPSALNITLFPALPADYLKLSELECLVFYNEPFSTVAYGPQRDSEFNIALRASQMARVPSSPDEKKRDVKAVLKSHDGEEKIVGFAGWKYITNRKEKEGKEEAKDEGAPKAKSEEEILKEREECWGPGANFEFCEKIFEEADEHMLRSCEGGDYCKLSTIVVHPDYQRLGIGTKLMEDGLNEADRLGLQAVLGASKEGEGLYKRYGFEEFVVMNPKLGDYLGGEGMGDDRHVVMHRPAQGK